MVVVVLVLAMAELEILDAEMGRVSGLEQRDFLLGH